MEAPAIIVKMPFVRFLSSSTPASPSVVKELPRADSPSCSPAKVPITPMAVRMPGIAASSRFSVSPRARLWVLKKCWASIVL